MTSGGKPSSFSNVDAIAPNPCQLIAWPVYPMRLTAAVMALSLSGRSALRGEGNHLGPLGGAKLAGSNEDQGRELDCRLHHVVSAVAVKRPQELRNLSGSVTAARFVTLMGARAPRRSTLGSRSARPVAIAYRITWLTRCLARCAVSCLPKTSLPVPFQQPYAARPGPARYSIAVR
jgi:hypothetical protein